jgi:hypothetical protein
LGKRSGQAAALNARQGKDSDDYDSAAELYEFGRTHFFISMPIE